MQDLADPFVEVSFAGVTVSYLFAIDQYNWVEYNENICRYPFHYV